MNVSSSPRGPQGMGTVMLEPVTNVVNGFLIRRFNIIDFVARGVSVGVQCNEFLGRLLNRPDRYGIMGVNQLARVYSFSRGPLRSFILGTTATRPPDIPGYQLLE